MLTSISHNEAKATDKTKPLQTAPESKSSSEANPLWQSLALGPGAIQRKARASSSTPNPSGQPLDPDTRSFMENRFDHDFGRVRLHTGTDAVAAADAVQAQAFTLGNDIVFGSGKYEPGTEQGKGLLAHELAHVVQQANATMDNAGRVEPAGSNLERDAEKAVAGESPVHERTSSLTIARQPQQPQPAIPVFSVDRAAYQQMLANAVGLIGGSLVDRETFSTIVQPALVAMLQSPEWRDSTGTSHGGATARYVHPGPPPLPLDLRLVLDDAVDPPDHGHFRPSGANAATVTLSVRRNPDATTAVITLYHEMMHFVAWLLNRSTPAISGPRFARRIRELDMSRHQVEIDVVTLHIEALAQSINGRRAAAAQTTVTRAEARRVARFLVEEVHVRAETEVFRLNLDEQTARATRGPSVLIGTAPYAEVNSGMVDRYIFDFTPFSPLFRPADRAGLNTLDRDTLRMITEILEGIFQVSVRHRYQRPLPMSIPRERPQLGPRPLEPPSFIPRIVPSTRRPPF